MAYNPNLPAGRYSARAIDAGVYETKGGALMLGVLWELQNDARDSIRSHTCLVSKAGIVQERRIESIREWAPGWDGVALEWFAEHCAEFNVELVIERRVDAQDQTEKPEVLYINPVGGKPGFVKPSPESQRALGEKYGARLRAIAGAVPTPSVAKPAKTATRKKTVTPAAPAVDVDARKSAAWAAFCEHYAGPEADRNRVWGELVGQAVPDKTDYAAYTGADWDAVMAAIAQTAQPDDVEDMPF